MEDNELRDTWQYRELKNSLEKNKNDEKYYRKTLFLANPKEKSEIDKIIRNHLWPGVLKGVGTSGIGIKSLDGTFPKSEIEDKRGEYTTRKAMFLLEDSRRHMSYHSNVPWYCRGEISCSMQDYMISFDFYIYFPESFSIAKLTRLLKNQSFAGMPPELSFSRSVEGEGSFCLSFSRGSGAGFGLHGYDTASVKIRDEIRLNIEVIRALYNLEKDYRNTKAFNELEISLVDAFGEE